MFVQFCFEGFDLVVFGGELDAQGGDDARFATGRGEVDGGGVAAVLIDDRDEVALLVDTPTSTVDGASRAGPIGT